MRYWLAILPLLTGCCTGTGELHFPGETHLKNVRQLTFEHRNTEAYFNSDDTYLVFQATGYGVDCEQIYRLELSRPVETLAKISTGIGTSAASFFYPNSVDILYSGNFHKTRVNAKKLTNDSSCPQKVCDSSKAKTDPIIKKMCESGHAWDVFPTYDIFKVNEYGNVLDQITKNDVYDSEAFISPDGKKIVYTSKQSGDLDLWITDINGALKIQLTKAKGYDGGASFSPDGEKIVFHASRPTTKDKIDIYDHLLENDLVAMSEMELYVMNADGIDKRSVFKQPRGGLNWTPYYHPDNKRIIFSSNTNSTKPSEFHLYIVNEDGTGLERVTFGSGYFNAFPVFSHDGKKVVWSSNRGSTKKGDLNLFIADWVDPGRDTDDESDAKEELRTNRIPKKATQKNAMRWQDTVTTPYDNVVHYTGERRLKNVKQLTFRGQNAEGYFSYDDSKIILQATGYGTTCDQIYELDLNVDPRKQIMKRMSTGLGGTTCSFFFNEPDNNHRLYAGDFWALNDTVRDTIITHTCPAKKCENRKAIKDPVLKELCNTVYTWDIYPEFDIFMVNKYGNIVKQLTDEPGYNAEAVLSPDGKTIAFTSIRTGDLELWTMNTDGTNLHQVTKEYGYDGGCFFSPDGKRLVFRASRPKTQKEKEKYQKLLDYGLVEPTLTEIYVVDVDGKNLKQVTNFGVASWAPYYLPDNKRIIFSSNYNMSAKQFGSFALYVINEDGTGLERVTFGEGYQFNAFPMFNRAGNKLVWGSSRNRTKGASLNLFIADWVDKIDDDNIGGGGGGDDNKKKDEKGKEKEEKKSVSVKAFSFSLLLIPFLLLIFH
uniref:Apical gut membrane polyprotein n=2 Tax=Haemonchus contortus TaxID=6289 RepID=Q25021_HAECO|nr:apical gut membrane polyprotein [Haemonchus contortus]